MTVSVSNDDDDEEDKRFAFSPSFEKTRCTIPAVREVYDLFLLRFKLPVPETPGSRGRTARVRSELICR
jgi:hypothetical protein